MNKSTSIGFSIVALVIVIGGWYLFSSPRAVAPVVQNVPQTEQLVSKNVSLPPSTSTQKTASSFPPTGWYAHDSKTLPFLGKTIMLTRQEVYPVGYCENADGACFGDQISIAVSTTTLTQESYIIQIVSNVYPSYQKWEAINDFKMFRMTFTTDATETPMEARYIFVGNKVYDFSLYPSIEKNHNDFQQVVDYYIKNISS